MKTKLTDITDVVRSKNSGPYELTLDIMFKRPICSGNLGETDVYGAQQHAPLLDIVLDI